MTALRTAARQALEALYETDTFHRNLPDQRARRLAAITALRAALAESGRDWSLLEATQESLREHMAEIHRLRAALAQQDEPVEVAERERVASQWDGCVTHQLDTFGPVDIGASIRAGELVEAQQAEPVTVDAAYQRWLEGTHAPALRRMDSQGAFAAGWQAALEQQAEPRNQCGETCERAKLCATCARELT